MLLQFVIILVGRFIVVLALRHKAYDRAWTMMVTDRVAVVCGA